MVERETGFRPAPSGPGDLAPTWTSSAKDLVVTALGPGRVWATLGHGILNEVYWPSTGEPQIRDLGFIVRSPGGWTEAKRLARYTIETPAPDIPLPRIVHVGDDWRLTLEILPDPARDALLIRYRLDGTAPDADPCRLHVLLAPRLGHQSDGNSAWAGETLVAEGGGLWLCLVADGGFSRTSAGHVGTSDGWQDFDRHGAMTWEWDSAGPGNVALTGALARAEGTLALGFSSSREGAATLARSSLAEGAAAVGAAALAGWTDWAARVRQFRSGALPPALADQARRSAAVLKAHEDRTFPGAVVASLSVPWGQSHDDLGGYHLVWARDAVNSALGLMASGQVADARRMLAYLAAMQAPDGHWPQNFYPDGRPFWSGVQLDEVAFPILLAARLDEAGALDPDPAARAGIARMVARAAGFLMRVGPVTPQDRWEENAGLSPYTLAVTVCALVAAADWLDGPARAAVLATADDWNARIEDWTWAAETPLARRHGVRGHYLRIVPDAARPVEEQRVRVQNRGGLEVPATDLVAMDFLALVRFGLRAADDPRIRDTLAVCEAELGIDTPNGRTYHRYPQDGYGEHADGAPFDGSGIGRGWPLLTGERGHYALRAGEDPLPWLAAMAAMTGPGGMLPEQVWDGPEIPSRALFSGAPTGGAMPLVWAHSEYLRLAVAMVEGRPVELLSAVTARWGGRAPVPKVRHWRSATPVTTVPPGASLRIEALEAFLLHYSFDGWATSADAGAEEGTFGLWSVTIPPRPPGEVVFTRRIGTDWDGRDHRVTFL